MNAPAAPRTARDALLAEALGDLSALLDRVEALPARLDGMEERAATSAKTLDEAGDRFRAAVTAFTEAAKQDLADYAEAQHGQLATRSADTLSEHTRRLQDDTRATLRAELANVVQAARLPHPGGLATEIQARLKPSVGALLAQMLGTALLAAALVFALLRFLPAR